MKLVNLDKERSKRKDIRTPFMVAESLYDEAINNRELDAALYITMGKDGEMTICYSGDDRLKIIGLLEVAKQELCLDGMD